MVVVGSQQGELQELIRGHRDLFVHAGPRVGPLRLIGGSNADIFDLLSFEVLFMATVLV